jgi:2-(1,2-epoxy-1,2-dihydrophenyl)acetyl-CoA isomerase
MSELGIARDGDVVTLTLTRPDRLNALTAGLRAALTDALAGVAADPTVGAVVLTGEGRAFCAGQDLAELGALPEGTDVGDLLRGAYNPLVRAFAELPRPVIAAINGPCVGAGLGLALACDLRLIAADAYLACAFVGIGLAPDAGVSAGLVRALGYPRALEIAASGRRVAAAEARALGLVVDVVEPGELAARAAADAARLAAGPRAAIAATKRLLRRAEAATLAEALEAEAAEQGPLIAADDHREGMHAFAERRPPRFARS